MVIVDTNIVAYLLLEGDRTDDSRRLHGRDGDWRSEPFLLVEFSNVLVTYVRTGDLDARQARVLLRRAEALLAAGLTPVPHADALRFAVDHAVSAYDGRFLAVASRLGGPLVTEDARLRAAAPSLTRSLAESLGRG